MTPDTFIVGLGAGFSVGVICSILALHFFPPENSRPPDPPHQGWRKK